MSLKSAPFYWVECDTADCAARCPAEGSEFLAWADEDQALMCSSDSDWTVTDAGEHYCWDHTPDDEDDDLSGLDEFTSHEATS